MSVKGYVSIILHAHLPFVRHPEHVFALEEDWLYEAITETYIPILRTLNVLAEEGINSGLTISLSPTLIEMLNDPLLQDRYVRHLKKLIELSEKEISRTKDQPQYNELAVMYNERYRSTLRLYKELCNGDIVSAFKSLQDRGLLEIITCAATHAYLPLLAINERAIRAQVKIACDQYRTIFGTEPKGIWPPELGYIDGLEKFYADEGLSYFIADAHGLLFADPTPRHGVYAPIQCHNGLSVFGRDMDTSKEVWSSKTGYPGDPCYRDFYRDIGFDLELDYIRPYVQPNGHRKMTGVKYHKITSGTDEKDIYNYRSALAKASEHANDFVQRRLEQVESLGTSMDRPPLVVSPYDAELFGHWWSEGPDFLEYLFRAMDECEELEIITPSNYLARHTETEISTPSVSSWGRRGYSEMWIDKQNDWLYRHVHKASERMCELADQFPKSGGVALRALNQAVRELLLAQGSDWAFIMTSGTSEHYAQKRAKQHLVRFNHLYEAIIADSINEKYLREIEEKDNLFRNINYRVYAEIGEALSNENTLV